MTTFVARTGQAFAAALLVAALAMANTGIGFAQEEGEDVNEGDQVIEFLQPTPNTDAILTGTQTIKASADASKEFAVLRSLHLKISSEDNQPIPKFEWASTPVKKETIEATWNTATLTKYNGLYKVVATATLCDLGCEETPGDEDFSNSEVSLTRSGLKVNNPPETPSGVQTQLQDGTPIVKWARNPEPDIKGYRVFRSDNGGAAQQVASLGPETSFTDPCQSCPAGALLTYQVAAVRSSPVDASGIASPPSTSTAAVNLGSAEPVQDPTVAQGPQAASEPRASQPQQAPKGNSPVLEQYLGYAPTLPYTRPVPKQAPAPVAAPPAEAPKASEPKPNQKPLSLVPKGSLDPEPVPKTRYVAGGLLLLIIAMHVARGGGLALASQEIDHRRPGLS